MANEPVVEWIGASGTRYQYAIFPRHPQNIPSGAVGNYIYSKVVNNVWIPIYIGQGDLSVRATKNHHQIECINSKGATAIHMHSNAKESDRLAEERDLLAGHPDAYTPKGCNVKIGG
jgi:hypothetical protein